MEDENDFVMLKIWKFDLALIKTQSCQFFESLSTKKPWKNKENCSPPKCYKITIKMCILKLKKRKNMAILHFAQHQSWWSYFQGQKIIYILPRPYFGTPCISVSPKTGIFLFHCQWFWSSHGSQILEICMCHYAGQIRILWLLLPGAVNCIVLKFI